MVSLYHRAIVVTIIRIHCLNLYLINYYTESSSNLRRIDYCYYGHDRLYILLGSELLLHRLNLLNLSCIIHSVLSTHHHLLYLEMSLFSLK